MTIEYRHDTYPCSSSWRVLQQSDWLENANRRLSPTISSNLKSSWFWSVWRLRPCFADSHRVYPGMTFTEKKSSFTFFSFFEWWLITLIWLLLGCTKTDDRLRFRCLWYLVSLSPNAISFVTVLCLLSQKSKSIFVKKENYVNERLLSPKSYLQCFFSVFTPSMQRR